MVRALGTLRRRIGRSSKWWWRFGEEKEALWRKVIALKYREDKWGWTPKFMPRYRLSCLWRGIMAMGYASNVRGDVFLKGVAFIVWEGKDVNFWTDDWVGVGFFGESFS